MYRGQGACPNLVKIVELEHLGVVYGVRVGCVALLMSLGIVSDPRNRLGRVLALTSVPKSQRSRYFGFGPFWRLVVRDGDKLMKSQQSHAILVVYK